MTIPSRHDAFTQLTVFDSMFVDLVLHHRLHCVCSPCTPLKCTLSGGHSVCGLGDYTVYVDHALNSSTDCSVVTVCVGLAFSNSTLSRAALTVHQRNTLFHADAVITR